MTARPCTLSAKALGRKAALGLLAADIHLGKHILGYARLYRKAAYLFGKLQPVHRLYKACIAYYIFYLIGLQMSDKVFFNAVEMQLVTLAEIFLHRAPAATASAMRPVSTNFVTVMSFTSPSPRPH